MIRSLNPPTTRMPLLAFHPISTHLTALSLPGRLEKPEKLPKSFLEKPQSLQPLSQWRRKDASRKAKPSSFTILTIGNLATISHSKVYTLKTSIRSWQNVVVFRFYCTGASTVFTRTFFPPVSHEGVLQQFFWSLLSKNKFSSLKASLV